jgi:eukaryotic-like serine/threonine-protein kinase
VQRDTVQRFVIRGALGAGGMGTVLRAYDPQLEREVAIKLLTTPGEKLRAELETVRTVDLRAELRPSTSSLLAEARVMARLSHPNVVPVYEVGLDGEEVFVVMELVEGENLRQWLASATRSVDEIRAVFREAAAGLAAAPARAIVHRDIKPDNILIGRDGRVRIADFGLSQITTTASLVRVAELGGTPRYMAPELWEGAPASPATDVFALCKALADAFTDHEPPAAVAALIEAGLADDPAARPTIQRVHAVLASGRGQGRRWSRMLVAGGVVTLVGAAGVIAVAAARGPAELECAGSGPSAEPWPLAHRIALRAKLGPADGADRALAALDEHARSWAATRL